MSAACFHSDDAAIGAEDARQAYLRADLSRALELTSSPSTMAVAFIRASALLRLKQFDQACATAVLALSLATNDSECVAAASLASIAMTQTAKTARASAWLDVAYRESWPTNEARALYGYAAAYLDYTCGDFDSAESHMPASLASDDPNSRARALALWAHISAARGDFRAHAAFLSSSLAIADQTDLVVLSTTLMQLSIIAREAALGVDVPQIEAALKAIPDVDRLREIRYQIMQNLAWYHALDGSFLRAYQLVEQAMKIVPSSAWQVTSHADYARFALGAGETVTAQMHLEEALKLVDQVDWHSLRGEERTALLDVVTLLARFDVARAEDVLAMFESLPGYAAHLAMAHDGRLRAALDHARGVQDPTTPINRARLEDSYHYFISIGYVWRAAEAASALSMSTHDEAWRRASEEALACFPRSWLARELKSRSETIRFRYPELTARQLEVASLIALGLTDREVAQRLNLEYNTVRNHVASVLEKTGASRVDLKRLSR